MPLTREPPSVPFFLVDAFADEPFGGNPACVVALDDERSDGWLQAVATELGAPATAFVRPARTPADLIGLRWFTPSVELQLCGHGTVAAAHVLWSERLLATGSLAHFVTPSGELIAAYDDGWVVLELPSVPSTPAARPAALLDALGVVARSVHRAGPDFLVELASPDSVRRVRPDAAALEALDMRGVMVTAAGGEDADFTSRFFAPLLGLPEDHVTGSAHAALGPFWAERLGRDRLVGHQVSPRGGRVRVERRGDLVALSGRARTVVRGALLV
jgi:PhzF family phenazine biosynthesis protein